MDNKYLNAYAAYRTDDLRTHSSSGGVFSIIANQFEIVYGVAMTADFYNAEFLRITNGDIHPLLGSKYFQAAVGDTFSKVKKDLESGKRVLFSGTGCQVNGLKAYLQKEYDNLFTVDVICHGTPSQKLWKKYIEFQEDKFGKIKNVSFRSKDFGWQKFGIKINDVFIPRTEDPYMQMFLRDFALRPSCYECNAKINKTSDISLADFWGVNMVAKEMNDDKGISLVITRSKKGSEMIDRISEMLVIKELGYELGIKGNPAEYQSAKRPCERTSFYKDCDLLDFDALKDKYASPITIPIYKRFFDFCISILVGIKHRIIK